MYAVICLDRPGSAPLRDAHRDAHMAHLTANVDSIVFAGPLKAEDGGCVDRMAGGQHQRK